jgi:hypothetical protein
MMRNWPVLAAVLLSLAVTAPVCGRTWTNRTGKFSVDAELVELRDGKAVLKRSDGRVISVRTSLLSKADRKYIRDELRRRREEDKEPIKSQPQSLPEPKIIQYGPARELCQLANKAIHESSGLACSRQMPGLFWTHNDAGNTARLYLFNSKGEDLGVCEVHGARAHDWEDMASFTIGRKSYLLIGDVGNNHLKADVQVLYLVEEPPINPQRGLVVRRVPVLYAIHYRYEDGRHNCESMAVDAVGKTILLVSKDADKECHVYTLPWPKTKPQGPVVAKIIATLKIPTTTAMDISPDGHRAVVLTYGNAHEYKRGPDEDWAAAFSRPPRVLSMPRRAQGETICYGLDGKTLYLTSEKVPTPLWEVPVKGNDDG